MGTRREIYAAEQWHDMQKQQRVDWMTLVQLVVCGSNALTFMHRAMTGRESGRSSHVADVITRPLLKKFRKCRNKAIHEFGKDSILNPLALLRGEFFIESSKFVCNVADEAEQWACKKAKHSSDKYWHTVNYDMLEKCTLTQWMSFQGDRLLTVPQHRSRTEQKEDKSITPENPNANASKMQENYQLLSKHNNTNSIGYTA